MATNVIMPALGVAQQTGTLLKWLRAEGQSVSKGEPLMEIETDKATVEIEAPSSGVLANVTASPGDEVPVGSRIAVILAPGEAASATVVVSHPRILPTGEGTKYGDGKNIVSATPPLPEGEKRSESQVETPPSHLTSQAVRSTESRHGRILASPAAKRIAREQNVDLASVAGSGPEGSVLAADILRTASVARTVAAVASTNHKIAPVSPMRRIVGERMLLSKQTAPHFYLSMDIDMTGVTRLRAERKKHVKDGVPSVNDFILHACSRALKDFSSVNSSFTEHGIKLHADINLGMAVALEEGLVVPVIRQADRLTLTELAAQSRELIDKTQKKKLLPLDCEGGTFTVSNLGMLGVDSFVAIINPPQCAILAVGRVTPRVVAEGDMFAIKPMMTATLSADHRVVDGAIGARFLKHVKEDLERAEF